MTSLGERPARELAGEVHADQLGIEHLPGEPGHRLAAVGAAHADGDHAEAARVGRVRVGADHEAAGEGVVLEHDLVDDARARASRSRCRTSCEAERRKS